MYANKHCDVQPFSFSINYGNLPQNTSDLCNEHKYAISFDKIINSFIIAF